ncbi:AAA domain-containing protein [Saccharothrix saharensis]|uniref:AAA domain-containing protein n=1 Tax=Saccharothrix saharensis TaxID=571190 RepID=A0A543JK96_9PSEU|nr:AAA family ATPase [Saccharothrix saharensis]TQM83191.1 AAA domain-containing protein [Saccharothrix saharensis]
MAIKIALFNNKGGVSKTTTCFNLGWMLAEQGKRVIMVDADPQCNLTGMVLDLSGEDALEDFYRENPGRNLKEALEPAFKSRPVPLRAVDCVEVPNRDGLFLIPGHVALAEDETSLGIAQQLSESLQGLRNLPGSFAHLFRITAEKYDADVILLDLSPGLGAINQNLVATADYFLVPCSPDVFSVMAVDSLSRVVPRWTEWANRAAKLEVLTEADYPFPAPDLKFLGVLVQRFRLKSGKPTRAFQDYFNKLNAAVVQTLAPALSRAGIMLDAATYTDAGMDSHYVLAEISDFNTLIAHSQRTRKPVFTLTQEDVGRQGRLWGNTQASIANFRRTFEELATKISKLTHDGK